MALKFRRGTTAQKSGSLAFGEPFINTDLNTLQIGGASGDITLGTTGESSAFAGVSVSASSFISGSGLKITGNAAIDGNLTLGGAITIGDATADTVNVIASLSSSLVPSNDGAFDVGKTDKRYKTIYANNLELASGSGLQISLFNTTANTDYHIRNNSAGNFTITNPIANRVIISANSASINNREGIYIGGDLFISGNVNSNTNSGFTGSFTGSIAGIGNVTSYSSSVASRLTSVELVSASAASALNSFSASNAATDATQTTNITTATTAAAGAFASASAYSASAAVVDAAQDVLIASLRSNVVSASVFTTFSTSVDSRLDSVELVSASAASAYAKIGSTNTFNGTQTISGSLIVTQDLVIGGSASIQHVTSSQLNISDNIITVNTINPTVRFGGLAVIDSGSAGISGSLLYDSVQDEWVSVHRGNGTNVTSSHVVMGPETYDNLGNETYLTANRIPKGKGNEHLNDSNITDDGTTITLGSNTSITGTLVATGTSLVSASAQITLSSTTGYSTFSSSVASTISNLGGTYATDAELSAVSSAVATTISNLGGTYATDAELSAVSGAFATTVSNLGSTYATDAELSAVSSAVATRTAGIDTTINTLSSSVNTRLVTLEGKDISVTLTGDVTGTGTITDLGNVSFATTIAANSVALGTDTTGDYVASMTAGTGITVGTATGEGSTPVITNTGVTSNVAGNAITVSGATGAVTINHADTSTAANLTATSRTYVTALTFDTYGHVTAYSTGTETVTDTNTVTTNIAGTGVSVSSGTGNSTISIGQAVATSDNVRFNSLGIGMAASATAGRIDASNDIVAFSSSDIRFKENITPIENALEKISKISGNTYDWKEENKAEHGYEGNDVGVIAQEIEAVLPQLVQTRESGYKAVKYDKLVALLIEGIKEQQTQIHSLTLEIEKLKESKGL